MKKIITFSLLLCFFCACDNSDSDNRKSPGGTLKFKKYLLGKDESISAAGDSLARDMNNDLQVYACRASFYVRLSCNSFPEDTSLVIIFNGDLVPRDKSISQHEIIHCGAVAHNESSSQSRYDAKKAAEEKADKVVKEKGYKYPSFVAVEDQTRYRGLWWTTYDIFVADK